jgi:FlgD Ig-like domain
MGGRDEAAVKTIHARRPSLAALVFAALVVATVGAFFVTTRLKRSAPAIEQLNFNRHFSPNGDGVLDYALFGFRLRRADQVTVSIVTRGGGKVRTLVENIELSKGRRYRFRWDGRTDSGRIAPDGEYHVRVGLRRQGRVATSPRKLFLDTTPPRPVVAYVKPSVITPGASRQRLRGATVRFTGPRRRPVLMVYRTDLGRPRLVARAQGRTHDALLHWDGRVGLGARRSPAPAGSYLLAVRVRDAAGNTGPRKLPPSRGAVVGHPGVAVRYVAAVAPTRPVAAGKVAAFQVFTAGRRYRWRVTRLGSGRSVSRGRSRAGMLHVRAPAGGSGVALLELSVGSHVYRTPFAVQGRRRERVLVALPELLWQAVNPVEQDGDGYPDVLPLDRAVGLDRPFAAGLPRGFSETVALLAYLRRERLRYDLTTDLALARDGAAALRGHRGVLIAGPERFAPPELTRLLGGFVQAGGRVAWLGTGGFSRKAKLTRNALVLGGRGSFLGERVRIERGPRALVVLGDRIAFFSGAIPPIGPFRTLEPSLRLPVGAGSLASAGAEPGRPDVVVYRLGRGVVARLGVDGFGRALETSPSAARIMRRLWTLLSR